MTKAYTLIEKLLFPPTLINTIKLEKELQCKNIIITGASSGIGEQLAVLLGEIDCHLILVARRKERLLQLQKQIKRAKISVFAGDLRDKVEMHHLISYIRTLDGKLDIIVNNAGISISRSIFDSLDRLHDFKRTMAINYFAPVELLLATIPILEGSHGQIINISTINTLLIPFPKFSAYQASKQAFDVWFQSVAPELNSKGIRTTSIYLPLVRTPMIEPTKKYINAPAMSPLHVAKIISKTMYTERKRFKPWWIIFGQVSSLLFRSVWERTSKVNMKKR